jgi:hypothetical protein
MSSSRKTTVKPRPTQSKNEAKSQSSIKTQSKAPSSIQKSEIFIQIISKIQKNPEKKSLNSKPFSSPGPGAYDPIDTSHSYSCLLLGKPKTEPIPPSPGPGSYNPEREATSASYSISQSKRFQEISSSPGPCDYEIPELKSNSPSFKISDLKKLPFTDSPTPGPGHYSPEERNHSPSAIFSSRREEPSLKTPGPGDYEVPPAKTYPKAAEYSMPKASRPDIVRNNYPGPGDYSALQPRRASAGTFGKSLRSSSSRSESPGPNFNPPSSLSTLGGVIGVKTPSKTIASPGPGSYSERKLSASQAFSFGRSKKFLETEASLVSPASYSPILQSTQLKPRFSRSPRKALFTDESGISMQSFSESLNDLRISTPGPGAYDPKTESFSPQFSIGKSSRFERIELSPGPGDYSPFKDQQSPGRTMMVQTSRLSRASKMTEFSWVKENCTFVKYSEQRPPKTRKNHYDRLKQYESFD